MTGRNVAAPRFSALGQLATLGQWAIHPSMTDAHAAVAEFLKDFSGAATPLSDDADIFDSLGIDGDDGFELIERFATKFEIDITNYRWYFHHGEEAINIGGSFFKSPYRRVDRISITPQVLAEALRTKRWPLEYPERKLPSVRWDIGFTQAIFLGIVALLMAGLWQRLVR